MNQCELNIFNNTFISTIVHHMFVNFNMYNDALNVLCYYTLDVFICIKLVISKLYQNILW